MSPDDTPEFDPFAGPALLATAPSTEPQREIWTAASGGVEASLCFNESVTLGFRGALDLRALETSFARLLARHEALRMTFSADGLTLLVSELSVPPLTVEDVAGADAERRFHSVLAEEVETPFDLASGPLFRVRCLRSSPEQLRVVITAHHAICDGWSTAVIVKDWARLYNAARSGESSPPLLAAHSFCDYAREQLSGAAAERQVDDEKYWLAQYAAGVPVLELPSDRPRPPLKTFGSRRFDGKLDAALVTALKKVGAKQRASLFTTLLAGFEALLFRISGQDDLVIGIPAAGQSIGGHDDLVGHCVNMLPLRARLSAALPFAEMLVNTRGAMLDAYDHQSYTFGTLISKLPIRRDPSRLPLVSVVFNVDRGLPGDAIGFEGVSVDLLSNPRHYENFDLFLNAVDLPDGVVLECQYNVDLFDRTTIERWLAVYEQLLRSVVADPSTPIGLLSIVPEAQVAELARWNAATRTTNTPGCVHQLIEDQAQRSREATALEFEGQRVSYRALDRRSNQVAQRLRELGIGRGKLVGLCLERSPEMLVGLLGILKSGAAYVPLDPGYPFDRLSFMATDAALAALVTDTKTRAELPLPAQQIVEINGVSSLSDDALPASALDATPDDAAYVIYTSGSTGKPKGVLVPHRSVVNLLQSVRETPGMTSSDAVLAVTTLSFDIAVSELILPLSVGARIVLASREVAADGTRLLELVESAAVSFIDATPATYRLLLAAGWQGDRKVKAICTGEALPRELARQLLPRVGSLWNGYGPTETTVWSTFYQVHEPVERILIGRPIANTQIHILDPQQRPAPIGVPGEIYIAGAGVTLGYLNRPELTPERFVPDPFAGEPEARMYRTGDVGRYLADGNIECLGRNDNQVKLRGYRIELGEIENALAQHEAVLQSAVIVREDRPGDVRLIGYVVLQPQAAVADSELKAQLKRSLPDYMVPSSFARLPQLPLTPSGKVDRKALPAPQLDAAPRSDFVAPTTGTETMLAGLWQEALGVPRVSIHDDFFTLGGHSLLASQLLARLRRDHGIQLSFRKIFEAPTIAQLAALIDDAPAPSAAQVSATAPVERRTATGPAPLSISQQRIWLLEEMDPSRELVHNLPAAWRLRGPVDLALLQRGLDEVARRHETLRTTFDRSAARPRQIVAPSISLPIRFQDLRALPETQREPAMYRSIAEQTRERFDLLRGPLFRSCLFQLADADFVYFSVRHNIIWDGWSFDVFLRELTTLYSAYAAGVPAQLPELPVSYSDYAVWQSAFLDGPEIARQIAYWREQLKGDLPELALPSDRPRPAQSNHAGANASYHLSQSDRDALSEVGRKHGSTLFMVLFGAFNVMLHRYSGQREIMVGTPVRARNRPEVEGLIGPFINAVALRTRLDPIQTFASLLEQIRETTLDAFSHEDMPLERLGIRPPVVRAFFSFQDTRSRPLSLGAAPVSQVHVEPPSAASDLMLWMMETRDGLLAFANYSTELFDEATIERFLGGFASLLHAVIHDPETPIGLLPIARPRDVELAASYGAPLGEPVRTLAEALAAQVAAQPSAAAVSDLRSSLSYLELARRSAGVAAQLEAAGVGRGKLVAIYAPVLSDRLAAVLGAHTSGAAFYLLEPGHPAARLRATSDQLLPDVLLIPEGVEPAPDLAVRPLRFGAATTADPRAAAPEHAPHDVGAVWCDFDGQGKPIARAISRAQLAHAAQTLAAALELQAQSQLVLLSDGPPLGLFEGLAALVAGATLIGLDPSQALDAVPGRIGHLIASPSSYWRLRPAELSRVERAVVSGEPTAELVEKLLVEGRQVLRLHAFDVGGIGPFVHALDGTYDVRCIGRVRYPNRALVLGSDGVPTPVSVPGALHVSSAFPVQATAALARFNSLGETRSGAPEPWLETGQRARFRADGTLELTRSRPGRAQLQGRSFELDEIGRVLAEHPAIGGASAIVTRPRAAAEQLTAYIVVQSGAAYTETELRRHLRASLPEHMIPQQFIEVDVVPSDARQSAPPPTSSDLVDYVAARTPAERLLAELWVAALGVRRAGIYDNFFDLGGHSLLCFEVIGRIEARTGQRLSPRSLLLGSLEQVAAELAQRWQPADSTRPSQLPAAPAPAPSSPPPARENMPLAGRLVRRIRGIVGRS